MTDPVYVVTICHRDPEVDECLVFEDHNHALDWAAKRAIRGLSPESAGRAADELALARACLAEDYQFSCLDLFVQIHPCDVMY